MQQIKKKCRFAELTSQKVPECALLLTKSFMRHNKIWSSIELNLQKLQKYMSEKALEILCWQKQLKESGQIGKRAFLNFIYLDQNDKVVAVSLNIELMQYLEKKSNCSLQEYNIFAKSDAQLQNSIDPRDKVPGLCYFNAFFAVHQECMGMGVMLWFLIDSSRYLHAEGFRIQYARLSNFRIVSAALKHGGEMRAKREILHKNTFLTDSLIKMHLQPFKYEYSLSALKTFNAKL